MRERRDKTGKCNPEEVTFTIRKKIFSQKADLSTSKKEEKYRKEEKEEKKMNNMFESEYWEFQFTKQQKRRFFSSNDKTKKHTHTHYHPPTHTQPPTRNHPPTHPHTQPLPTHLYPPTWTPSHTILNGCMRLWCVNSLPPKSNEMCVVKPVDYTDIYPPRTEIDLINTVDYMKQTLLQDALRTTKSSGRMTYSCVYVVTCTYIQWTTASW